MCPPGSILAARRLVPVPDTSRSRSTQRPGEKSEGLERMEDDGDLDGDYQLARACPPDGGRRVGGSSGNHHRSGPRTCRTRGRRRRRIVPGLARTCGTAAPRVRDPRRGRRRLTVRAPCHRGPGRPIGVCHLRSGGVGIGAGGNHRRPHCGRTRCTRARSAHRHRSAPAGVASGHDIHRDGRGHGPDPQLLLRCHCRGRGGAGHRTIAGTGDGRRTGPYRRERPHPLSRCTGPWRESSCRACV